MEKRVLNRLLADFPGARTILEGPVRAVAEGARVARMGVLLGVLNSHSVLAWQYRRFGKATWKSARFFSVREFLGLLVRRAIGPRMDDDLEDDPLAATVDLGLAPALGRLYRRGVRLQPPPEAEGKSA